MPRVYRLVRKKYAKPADLLTGVGAAIVGGRWNEKGTRMLYTTSHVSLAVLEALVHAQTLPTDMVLVALDLPTRAPFGRWPVARLPAGWDRFPFVTATQTRGTAWAIAAKELAVWVPSAVVAAEWNCLVNPAHPRIADVRAKVLGPFRFDPRL